ncbi:MAG: GAF domain-containing protein [Gemmatimonadota bacterium]
MERLQARVEELELERKRLIGLVDLLRDVGNATHYLDIVQAVARRLGASFGLDRCSVFLTERSAGTVHLVASYEDPSIRNHIVDVSRYPELKRALDTGEVVNIPDATHDPALGPLLMNFSSRKIRSITVVPLTWRGSAIGAIFLRTFREGAELAPEDIEYCRTIADLTSRALRSAHRLERLLTRRGGGTVALTQDRERAAMLSFIRRMLVAFGDRAGTWDEGLLARASATELDRLVGVALTVVSQEAQAR